MQNFAANLCNDEFRNVPWHTVENESNIDDVPVKRQHVKGTPLPWTNSKISETMKERDWIHRKARKSNFSPHWSSYRKLRNIRSTA